MEKDTLIITSSQEGFMDKQRWIAGPTLPKWREIVKFAALLEDGEIRKWAELIRLEPIWNPDQSLAVPKVINEFETPILLGETPLTKPFLTTKEALLSATTTDDLLI